MAHPAAILAVLAVIALTGTTASGAAPGRCRATAPDSLGPFYEAGAPVRSKVGAGYVMHGRVLSAVTCLPIRRARIEFWLVNPKGEYDDAHRATVFARTDGRYRFESNRPIAYGSRPAHIHLRVTAGGFRTLVTQHYPRSRTSVAFDLVLRRA